MSEQNPDCYNYFWINLILVCSTIGFFMAYRSEKGHKDSNTWIVVATILYFIMLIESFVGKTCSFLSNIESADRGREVINEVRIKPPSVEFRI